VVSSKKVIMISGVEVFSLQRNKLFK